MVAQVSNLFGEIASACDEQAKGIEQITVAVGQLDRTTQANAGGAEEAAASSEQMNTQAESLNRTIEDLTALVGLYQAGNAVVSHTAAVRGEARRVQLPDLRRPALAGVPEQKPASRIPLDRDDLFEEF